MEISTIVVIIVSVLVAVIRFRRSAPISRPEPKLTTLDDHISFLTGEAIDIADKSFHIKLDYNPASIEIVENLILSKFHEEYLQRKSNSGERGLAMAFGAYVGECIRRSERDSRWEMDDPDVGKKTFPLHWRGGRSFPMQWCLKRITNGVEDNVWHKYLVLKQQGDESKTSVKIDSLEK